MAPIFHKAPLAALLVGALLASSAHTQTRPPAPPPAVPNTVEGVVVVGKQRPITRDRLLRLNRRSAASCFFEPGYNSHAEDFVRSMRSGPPIGLDPRQTFDRLDLFDEFGRREYLNINGPLGDASSGGGGGSFFSGYSEGCTDSDLRALAGRAHIARRDRTLPTGFALYEAGRYPEALAMFRKAHHKLPDSDGGAEAALMIGKIQLLGQAGAPNVPEALMWLRRAAGTAVPFARPASFNPADPDYYATPAAEAAMILGRVHLYGYRTPKDPEAAARWFRRAEYVGHVPAAKILGDLYFYGPGPEQDARRAAAYYKKAAQLGFAPAQYSLAEIRYRGADGAPADMRTALAWYGQAANRGHPEALYALAVAHDTGDGVPADPNKALVFYKEAALAGNAPAQSALGTYFYEGRHVSKDDPVARKWFEAAAVRGDPDAMFNLAVMQMKGEGGAADRVKAWVWFKLADRLKRRNAAAAAQALEQRMTPAERTQAAEILEPRTAS